MIVRAYCQVTIIPKYANSVIRVQYQITANPVPFRLSLHAILRTARCYAHCQLSMAIHAHCTSINALYRMHDRDSF